MKLLRYKKGDLIQPGILDSENKVRNVSSLIKDWNNLTISTENINKINSSNILSMPIVDEDNVDSTPLFAKLLTKNFVNNVQFLAYAYILYHGFTVSIADCISTKSNKIVKRLVKQQNLL